MEMDSRYLQFLLDCIDNKKPKDIIDVAKFLIKRSLNDGRYQNNEEMLLGVLTCLEKTASKEEKKEIYDNITEMTKNRIEVENADPKGRYATIGCGATNTLLSYD